MKKLLLFILFTVFCKWSSAQFITLPDTNFRNYIHDNIDSSAIVGNKLDTTNSSITSLRSLELYFFNNLVEDLTGIEYFDSLEILKVNYLNLMQLPTLPPRLVRLEAQANLFQSLPDLPESLQYLDVSYNDLHNLVSLPNQLTVLIAGFNHFHDLPQLSDSLLILRAQGNEINYLDGFPAQLREITLWNNRLDSIGVLPASLQSLNVSDNRLKRLPSIPDSVTTLFISYNNLQEFPVLPAGLQYLDCSKTVSCLPPLPVSLQHLYFDGCLSALPPDLEEYYPVCHAQAAFTEIADVTVGVCNDVLNVNSSFASYLWNTGDTTSTIDSVCRGIYSCLLTDSIGCIYNTIIDISDSSLTLEMVVNTQVSCNQVGMCGYVTDLMVKGGTPPYRYKWSGANGEIDFSVTADSTEDLIHFCLSDITSSEIVKCVVTDATGRKDSVTKVVMDNIPPQPFYVDIVNPVCAAFPTGYIYLEDDPIIPGGNIFIMETGLDAGNYIYTVPFGNSCQQTYSITLDYQFQNCENMYSYTITNPDSAMCNGSFALVDQVDHGIYNLANTEIAYDGMYLSDGSSIASNDLCLNTWYYFFVYDFNIGYFVQDSIYITEPEYSVVYPGDVNNDGVADKLDWLYLGIAMNESGNARVDNGTDWTPKSVQNWMQYFADSTNMAFADGNGSGVVHWVDSVAIINNYGFTHSRPVIAQTSVLPVIYINVPDTIVAGSEFNIPVVVSDSLLPLDSVYGLAFRLAYDSSLIDPASIVFIPDSSFLGEVNNDVFQFSKSFPSGITEVAFTRGDHQNRSGYGNIGYLHAKFSLVQDTSYLYISTSDITYTSYEQNFRPADGFTDSTVILPAACQLQASFKVQHGCNSLYGASVEVMATNVIGSLSYSWSAPHGNVLPVSLDQGASIQDSLVTATYEVIVTDSSGCRDTVTALIRSDDGNSIYSVMQNPSCRQLCDGWIWVKADTIAGASFTTNWNNGPTNAIQSGLCKGLYMVTIHWGIGCARTDTFQLADPRPLTLDISVDSAACDSCNGMAEVAVVGGRKPYLFDWQSITDTSMTIQDSLATGLCFNQSYILTVTDGCGSAITDSVLFDNCDSITSGIAYEEYNKPSFVIAPNPNNGRFQVITEGLSGTYLLEVHNMSGAVVYSEGINNFTAGKVDIGSINPGFYICTLTGSNEIRRVTFIVN